MQPANSSRLCPDRQGRPGLGPCRIRPGLGSSPVRPWRYLKLLMALSGCECSTRTGLRNLCHCPSFPDGTECCRRRWASQTMPWARWLWPTLFKPSSFCSAADFAAPWSAVGRTFSSRCHDAGHEHGRREGRFRLIAEVAIRDLHPPKLSINLTATPSAMWQEFRQREAPPLTRIRIWVAALQSGRSLNHVLQCCASSFPTGQYQLELLTVFMLHVEPAPGKPLNPASWCPKYGSSGERVRRGQHLT